MKEYIEREAVKSAVKKRLGTMDLFESRFNADIDAIPSADVVERKRGEWVDISCVVHDPDGDWIATQYQCSLCGRKEYMKEPFCNCGADMREVDHDNN